ncbi:MAG TPA: right-handed parallel beta-helix repeat-containing protein [Segetibacter sp.]|jgi:hypothetical protein
MKKLLLSFLFILGFAALVDAKIWRVNNNAGVPADFTTAQAAHNGAGAGDTLHFEPSPTSYGGITMAKRLVLIGVGDFLDINSNNQATNVTARLDGIDIRAGADNSTIMVSALYLNLVNVQGVIIQRCNVISRSAVYIQYDAFSSIWVENASNTIIRNCFLSESGIHISGSTNVQIINNIMADFVFMRSASSATIMNNVINGKTVTDANSIQNATVRNNIFSKSTTFSCSSCVVENNIASANILPAGNGNQNNVDMTTVFNNPNTYVDKAFQLKPGSPAIGAGVGGVDAGAYGGISPYHLSVQPNIPAIYKLVAPAVVTGSTMTVTISTKSNN